MLVRGERDVLWDIRSPLPAKADLIGWLTRYSLGMLCSSLLLILALNVLSWGDVDASAIEHLEPERAQNAPGPLSFMEEAHRKAEMEDSPSWDEINERLQRLKLPSKTPEPATGHDNHWLHSIPEINYYPEVTYPKLDEIPDYPEVTYPKLDEVPDYPEVTYPKLYEVLPGQNYFHPSPPPLAHDLFPGDTGQTRQSMIGVESPQPQAETIDATQEDDWPAGGECKSFSDKSLQAEEPPKVAVGARTKRSGGRRAKKRPIKAQKPVAPPEPAQPPGVKRSSMRITQRERGYDKVNFCPGQLKELFRLKALKKDLARQRKMCDNDFQAGKQIKIERKLKKVKRAIECIEKTDDKSRDMFPST